MNDYQPNISSVTSTKFPIQQTLALLAVLIAIAAGGYWLKQLFLQDQAAIDAMLSHADVALAGALPEERTATTPLARTPSAAGFQVTQAVQSGAEATLMTPAQVSETVPLLVRQSASVSSTNTDLGTSTNLATAAPARQATGSPTPVAASNNQPRDDTDDEPEPGLEISGQVVSEAGDPLSGIGVSAKLNPLYHVGGQAVTQQDPTEHHFSSGTDGYFRFEDLQDGEYQVYTVSDGVYPSTRSVVRAGTANVSLVLPLYWELPISGTVTDLSGNPVVSAVIVPSPSHGSKVVTSDQQGRYTMTLNLPINQRVQTLRIDKSGYKKQQLRITESDWNTDAGVVVDITLEPIAALAEVSGTLMNELGEPIGNEPVSLYSPDIGRNYRANSDADGQFLLQDVAVAEDYQLTVQPKEHYHDYALKDFLINADGLHLDIVLDAIDQGKLSGFILDSYDNPVPGFSFWVRSNDARRQSFQVTSDANGLYSVADVPAGELHFETRSWPLINISGLELIGGADQQVDLIVDRGDHELRGRVVDMQGQALSIPEVYLVWEHQTDQAQSRARHKTATDAEGYFLFSQLGPGVHKVQASLSGFRGVQQAYEIGSESGEIILELEEANN